MAQHSNHRATWSVARASATLAVAVTVGLGMVGCGGDGNEQLDPTSGSSSSSATPASSESPDNPGGGSAPAGDTGDGSSGTGSDGGDPGSGGNSGSSSGGDSGSSSGDSSDGGPANEPPYIRDLYKFVDIYEDEGEQVLEADLSGHAFDPDSEHDQGNVARVTVHWGDGTTSDGSLGGHGAFSAIHAYELSYEGQTVTVQVVAHGYDGQTATKTVQLTLAEE